MSDRVWIAVDLDGTLAHYDGWIHHTHVGEPVPQMLSRVRRWINQGRTVRIFTARVSAPEPERSEAIAAIQNWLVQCGLPPLEVTNVKDFKMVEMWCDRAVGVVPNTGRRISEPALAPAPAQRPGEDRVIFLAPACCAGGDTGRHWCRDNVWPCLDCPVPGLAVATRYEISMEQPVPEPPDLEPGEGG